MKTARDSTWQTSNMEYGRFYTLTSEDGQRKHAVEREGRYDILTKPLFNCQKQVGLMRLRDSSPPSRLDDDFDPPTSSYCDAHLQRVKMAQTRFKNCAKAYPESEQATVSRPSAERLISMDRVSPLAVERPGPIDPAAIEEDTKQLEWILHRLADKLQPLTSGELPILNSSLSANALENKSTPKHSRTPKFLNQGKPLKTDRPGGYRHHPASRYGFYRHYGGR